MTDSNIGRLLAKRYQLQDLLGTGAMGRVYRAKDVLLGGVPVAVKFLALSIHNKKLRVQERFEKEAKTCALLGQKSIHIVRVMDYGVDENGTPFYVMEYLQGENLSDIIYLQPIPCARFLSLVRQIGLGLQYAHQGILIEGEICPIIHRDIKPSNILVIQDSSFGELVKILDFGIAKLLQANSDQTSYYLGTLAYSSPEQMEGKEIDNRSDIYSLGVMMFEMLTGKMPIQPDTESFGGWYKAHHFQPPYSFDSVDPLLKIPKEVENLVMSCLAKAPGDRPQSVSEILQVLISLEQRYSVIAPVSQRIESATASINQVFKPVVKSFEHSLSVDEACQLTSWPKNKPIADIVFSHSIRTKGEVIAALWVMLPQQEIQKRLQSRHYNQFLFITSPHPMMLWITVLYNRKYGPKWFPYYLDLKTRQGQESTQLLGEMGCYRLLLFARESPQHVENVMLLVIASAQRQLLQEWAMTSQTLVSAADPQLSKNLLKKEFEKIKPQILMKLEGTHISSQLNISS
jgi:serine/threonine-protein kinase